MEELCSYVVVVVGGESCIDGRGEGDDGVEEEDWLLVVDVG